jgi:hypothetical protein
MIKDKMLGTFMEKLGCKHLISWKQGYREDVSVFNFLFGKVLI